MKDAGANYKALFEEYISAYRHQSIKSFEDQGGIITVGIKFEAILAVDLPNGSKAGDSLKLEGKSIFEFKDGKLWRITDYS